MNRSKLLQFGGATTLLAGCSGGASLIDPSRVGTSGLVHSHGPDQYCGVCGTPPPYAYNFSALTGGGKASVYWNNATAINDSGVITGGGQSHTASHVTTVGASSLSIAHRYTLPIVKNSPTYNFTTVVPTTLPSTYTTNGVTVTTNSTTGVVTATVSAQGYTAVLTLTPTNDTGQNYTLTLAISNGARFSWTLTFPTPLGSLSRTDSRFNCHNMIGAGLGLSFAGSIIAAVIAIAAAASGLAEIIIGLGILAGAAAVAGSGISLGGWFVGC